MEGSRDGEGTGLAVGPLGPAFGTAVGQAEGAGVGSVEGAGVDPVTGWLVGPLGLEVGFAEGLAVGLEGLAVGRRVGAEVGLSVGITSQALPFFASLNPCTQAYMLIATYPSPSQNPCWLSRTKPEV